MRTRLMAFGSVLAGLLAASPAAAAVSICVTPPSVTTCANHTITAALASAGPGAVIKVAPGIYYEDHIVIPTGYDGLQIIGSSKTSTILDIGINTLLGKTSSTFQGFVISSRNVTVKNLTVRNGYIGLISSAPGTLVTGMIFQGQTGYGVSLFSYNAQVVANEFHAAATGIHSIGFGTIAKGNTVTNAMIGIDLNGDQSQALLNKVSNGSVGISAFADGCLVKSNDVRYQSIGIHTAGAYPTVQSNVVLGTGIAIQTSCTQCFGGSVASNTITDATTDGILVTSDNPGLYVQSNSILRAGAGIEVSNPPGGGDHAVFLVTNKATDIGNRIDGHCYFITGDGNFAYKNQATRCSGSGLRVQGNSNTLDSNTANGTFENGITVDGFGGYGSNYLTNNKTTGNTGDGIAIVNGAASTTVQFTSASANRKPFCDQNRNGTILISNSFADPGAAVPCDIFH